MAGRRPSDPATSYDARPGQLPAWLPDTQNTVCGLSSRAVSYACRPYDELLLPGRPTPDPAFRHRRPA